MSFIGTVIDYAPIEIISHPEPWYFYSKKVKKDSGRVFEGRALYKSEVEKLIKLYSSEYIYCCESDAPSWVLNNWKDLPQALWTGDRAVYTQEMFDAAVRAFISRDIRPEHPLIVSTAEYTAYQNMVSKK